MSTLDLKERLIDKLGVDVETLQPDVYKSGDMVYHVQPDSVIGEHMTAGNKFTYLWTDSLDTFQWVDALMSYEMWTPRLGEVIRLLDTMPEVFISGVSAGYIALDADVPYIDKSDYLAFILWRPEGFEVMDGANGDRHIACTAQGVIDRLAWCMRFNAHYHVPEVSKI